MRFEQKDYMEQLKTLKRLHKYLNREIFKNALSEDIVIDICNINKGEGEDNAAVFSREHFAFDAKTMTPSLKEAIFFGHEFIDNVACMNTQATQVCILGQTMLHEMIHQYCYENGLDDANHGGQWKETAERFELVSIYEDGELISETLTKGGVFILSYFRLR